MKQIKCKCIVCQRFFTISKLSSKKCNKCISKSSANDFVFEMGKDYDMVTYEI